MHFFQIYLNILSTFCQFKIYLWCQYNENISNKYELTFFDCKKYDDDELYDGYQEQKQMSNSIKGCIFNFLKILLNYYEIIEFVVIN